MVDQVVDLMNGIHWAKECRIAGLLPTKRQGTRGSDTLEISKEEGGDREDRGR